ncbi:tyrosine-type recombinase/integrase [Pseudomonas wadenswilerensis]|uniref:tyrosine-type recombinase/integrase n=1 Tax=Pseudomonas wadenswilerensis TaxID=1785161 RepID=UPI00215F15F8|nr:tyrosine-type recombinase/integrase [Pseudomonas wadenswilerensis]UVM22586.1 tyrosine-type recombinase/integrase [Pseudomonas wadenswilerensis]
MNILAERRPVTSAVTSFAVHLRPTTRLAKLYHYRRNGIYYLRLRETGSTTQSASVSLKTTDRRAAMDASQRLAETIKAFHLDHPKATFSELKEHLLWMAENLLSTAHEVHSLRDWGDLYEDVKTNLAEIAATMPLSVDQHEHVMNAKQVMIAAQARLQGDSVPLVKIIRDLEGSHGQAGEVVPSSVSVLTPSMTFEILSGLYLADRGQDQKASTLKETKVCHNTLSAQLGELDLRNHSRADLVALRDRLSEGRMASTVNKLIIKLSAVLTWAVENGHLLKSYDKKLKLTKGLESTRRAFSQDQIGSLMTYANELPDTSWKRWLLSLGIITGGRLNEISQLSVSDIQTLESGIVVIHINEAGEGKSIKNKRSERLVPLTDGAYGFDLQAFLKYVEECKHNGSERLAQIGYKTAGEWANQQAIPQALGESFKSGLTFHSLRHSLASLMQVRGIPTAHAQAVMGHASGTVTFDIYGSGVPVMVIAEMLKGLLCGRVESH